MLQKVSIQNFKSLKDVTLELQKVNLLIGPNNTGKSNFLKALDFKNTYNLLGDLDTVYGNFQNLIFQKQISFISRIKLLLQLDSHSEEIVVKGVSNQVSTFWGTSDDPAYDELTSYSHNLKHRHNNINIYKPDPNKLQKPFPILPNQSYVNSDASNLVAFLDILQGRYRDSFVAIENDLNKCIPEFSRIELDPVEITKDDDLFKIYGDKTFKRLGLYDNINKITYWADELSEGTLYFLALLCIVHQPNPPKLLLLEEPEKGIHPRRIKEVIDFIFQLTEDKDIQVIMTTHSERVLDEFEDIPEAVFVFDKDEEGATQVKNLLKDVIGPSDKLMDENNVPKIKFTESLGSHWITGFIGGVPR
jgi:predicted ATPase